MMEVNENLQEKDENKIIPKSQRKRWVEFLYVGLILFFLGVSLATVVFALGYKEDPTRLVKITYSANKEFVFDRFFLNISLFLGGIYTIGYPFAYAILRPSGITPSFGKHGRYLLPLIILDLFGYLAYLVIALFFSSIHLSFGLSSLIATLLVGIYDYLIYKMYAENRTLSNSLFWEIFRFAIVGLVAAVFDFAICLLIQFLAFKGNEEFYVTIIATACGFIVGVIINYLMSTYMVYKAAKTNFSKSAKGMLAFFILSAIGLGIGIGLQYFLYDFLYLNLQLIVFSYPLDFVIRTLIVMVYNYITRKIFIYK